MTSAATTVGSSVYLKIKSDIITGALTPGKKLKLDALKVQYSASVSTLRETLNRLASDGFVDAPEQRGFLVRTMSNEDLIELSNLRVLLQCAALKASLAFGDENWEGSGLCPPQIGHDWQENYGRRGRFSRTPTAL